MSNKKDWKGNDKAIFSTLGASSHSEKERQEHDYYATDPKAIELLLKLEDFNNVWEPACGEGHLSDVLKKHNIHSRSSDLISRGYSEEILDFLAIDNLEWNGDIITNPPFKYAKEFVEKSLQITQAGSKIAMFLRIQFLETKDRKELFKSYPPKYVYVASSRIMCAKNGNFTEANKDSSATCYCWFIWENGYKGETILKWFN